MPLSLDATIKAIRPLTRALADYYQSTSELESLSTFERDRRRWRGIRIGLTFLTWAQYVDYQDARDAYDFSN